MGPSPVRDRKRRALAKGRVLNIIYELESVPCRSLFWNNVILIPAAASTPKENAFVAEAMPSVPPKQHHL